MINKIFLLNLILALFIHEKGFCQTNSIDSLPTDSAKKEVVWKIKNGFKNQEVVQNIERKKWQFDCVNYERKAMNQLLIWSTLSMAGGMVMIAENDEGRTKDMGIQHLSWGAIDAAIALYSQFSLAKKIPDASIDWKRQAADFNKVLKINGFIDLAYVAAGLWMINSTNEQLVGHGYGILIQGSFLLGFDWFHYFSSKRKFNLYK